MATSSSLILQLAAALLCLLPHCAAATDHIVGANKGWNPGVNYTLWANNHTFYVGDLISFRYQKTQYNVFEVNQTGYDNCTVESATGNWSSGKDFIPLNKAKRYYFVCGTGGCFSGMKVSVLVHALPPPPTAALAGGPKDSSAPATALVGGWDLIGAVLSGLFTTWFGFGLF
ncbi:early nodulin-like protein 17 [Primulina tabacum]|uniref:early nodulin-like protein 17 n=1 Tax=Primulina tabacum TaxID=48773 RepID=UPI003F5A58A4